MLLGSRSCPRVRARSRAATAVAALLLAAPVAAQEMVRPAGGRPIGSYEEDRWRVGQLDGSAPTAGFLLRSLSSTLPAPAAGDSAFRWSVVGPYRQLVHNSALPFSLNDGALWAGRGISGAVRAGVQLHWRRLHAVVAPELVASANGNYPVVTRFLRGADTLYVYPHQYADTTVFPNVPGRSPFASPFHARQSIDLPIRMGEYPLARLHPGQTALWVDLHRFQLGAGTENGWWGPALQNPLLLSNTAPGFAHAFLRTAAPWETPVGAVEGRWLVGTLRESDYFDYDARNDRRSISMLALTWQPRWHRDLTVGAARSVFGAVRSWDEALLNFNQVFRDVGMPNDKDSQDPSLEPGLDQLFSVFFRWVMPRDGAEVYGEWGRYMQPRNLHELLEEPNQSQGYTVGLQWVGDPSWRAGRARFQGEFTFLQQDASFLHRYTASWYTSRAASQGYTNRGQMLGAGIGPGSSSQWLALDWMEPRWYGGLLVQRVRWLEDVHAQRWWGERRGWCEHDVSMLHGARAGAETRWGTFTAQFSQGWRVNTFFENHASGCPQNAGRNHWNRSLSVSISPRVR